MQNIISDNKKHIRNRLFFLLILFIVILLLLLLKVAHIQVLQESYYTRFAQGQSEESVIVPAIRGQIFDRNNSVIVDNRPSYSLNITPAFFPKEKRSRRTLINYLSKKLNISSKKLIEKITIKDKLKQNKYISIIIKRDLEEDLYTELKENEARLEGVTVDVIGIRRYLLENSLSHVLGYTGIIDRDSWLSFQEKYKDSPSTNPYRNQNSIIGKLGIERYEDITLRGQDGLAVRLVDSKGRPIPDSTQVIKESRAGKNIYLTIDKDLQQEAKNLLKGKRGVIIVSKPATGEILAMVSNPSFNGNDIVSRESSKIKKINLDKFKLFFNRAMQGTYPPSSIFKIVVAIAALEEGEVSLKKKVNCTGAFPLGNRVFKCHKTHGKVNLVKAIEKSCNYYFYTLALDIGWDTIYKYAKLLRLGFPHKLEFASSIKGIIPDKNWKEKQFSEAWFRGDTLNHAIGQGYIILPPIQVHNIMSIIATGGSLYKPYIIHSTEDALTKEREYAKKSLIRQIVLKDRTLKVLRRSLRGVIERGTGYYGRFSKKYPILGKTGTAQNPHGYDHAWFTSFASSEDGKDQIVITVIVEDADNHGGGFISAPIATALVRYYFGAIPIAKTQKDMGRLLYAKASLEEEKEGEGGLFPSDRMIANDKKSSNDFTRYEQEILSYIKQENKSFRISLLKSGGKFSNKALSSNQNIKDLMNDILLKNLKEANKVEEESRLMKLREERQKQKKELIQKRKTTALEKTEEIVRLRKEKERTREEQEITKKVLREKKRKSKSRRKEATSEQLELERLKKIVEKEKEQIDKDKYELDLLD